MKQINRFKILNIKLKRLNIKVKIIKRYHAQKQIILLLSQNPLLVHNACKADTGILLVSSISFF